METTKAIGLPKEMIDTTSPLEKTVMEGTDTVRPLEETPMEMITISPLMPCSNNLP